MKFYQLPNSNLFTHRLLFFSREATSETYDSRVFFLILFSFAIYFFLAFIFRSIKPKIQKYLAAIFPYLFIWHSIYQFTTNLAHVCLPILRRRTPKGIDNPFNTSGCECCYLCAGAIYVVLLGCPTGSITLVSYLREIPTAAVLHHPFLFGEIPT